MIDLQADNIASDHRWLPVMQWDITDETGIARDHRGQHRCQQPQSKYCHAVQSRRLRFLRCAVRAQTHGHLAAHMKGCPIVGGDQTVRFISQAIKRGAVEMVRR